LRFLFAKIGAFQVLFHMTLEEASRSQHPVEQLIHERRRNQRHKTGGTWGIFWGMQIISNMGNLLVNLTYQLAIATFTQKQAMQI